MTPSAWAGAALLLAGLILAAVGAGRGRPRLRTGGLSLLLAGFFIVFVAALPAPLHEASRFRAALLIGGAVALFRLLSAFEKGRT